MNWLVALISTVPAMEINPLAISTVTSKNIIYYRVLIHVSLCGLNQYKR